MAYDRADWHYGGDFPPELPIENGGTHIWMFIAWAITNKLEGQLLIEETPKELEAVRARKMTGREFLFEVCDEKFWEDDLNEEGNAFAKFYYETDKYIQDYAEVLSAGLPTLYHVADTWENYEKLAKVIDKRFMSWKKGLTKAWWQIWK